MPALNIINIKDAKLGSTDLSAVYKGSTQIWQASSEDLSEYVVNLRVYTAKNTSTFPMYEVCFWMPMIEPNTPGEPNYGSIVAKAFDPSGMYGWYDLRPGSSYANPDLRHTHNGIIYRPMQCSVQQAFFDGRMDIVYTTPNGQSMQWKTEADGVWQPSVNEYHAIKKLDGYPELFWSDDFPDLGIISRESELEDG